MMTIFLTFFTLGWISFGGPAAHMGYFRHAFVENKRWLSNEEFSQLVALSQFLPGPGSSQVGFAIGYKRGGFAGAWAAFAGFTLPSVLIMLVLAYLNKSFIDSHYVQLIIHGLKLLAVVIVADAARVMYFQFCQNKLTTGICGLTAMMLLLSPGLVTESLCLILAAAVGMVWLKPEKEITGITAFRINRTPLILFLFLLLALPVITGLHPLISLFHQFFQAGSLVFGGGHVVLPLLQNVIGAYFGAFRTAISV